MRIFWLYRPQVPVARAQSIQVVHMAHAMARRGHEVTLCVEPIRRTSLEEVLAFYGLSPHPMLQLHLLSRSRTVASVSSRGILARFLARGGVVYSRSKKYTAEVLRFWPSAQIVQEVHEVDSLQFEEAGRDPAAMRALESRVFAGVRAVVANCPGTLSLLQTIHTLPPAVALHNGCHASRIRHPTGPGEGVGYVGSIRPTKDLRTLADAAHLLSPTVTVVTADRRDGLEGPLEVEGPIAPDAVPDRLAGFRVLVLPLSDTLFGRHLTSPLKLWDYLASGRPIVAADLPTLHDAAPGAFYPYEPGDSASLAAAVTSVYEDQSLSESLVSAARVRTWADRAAELEAFLKDVG